MVKSTKTKGSGVGVCIIVENAAAPADARVWLEALTLTASGYRVTIICPKAPGFEEDHVVQDGIEIYRHSSREGCGKSGYLFEYTSALISEFYLALKVYRRTRFRILQACNPPDAIFLIALFFKFLFGTRFIFDHHDPSPELYETRYGRGFLYWVLRLLERLTFQTADIAIATNRTIGEIAIRRGHVRPDQVFVVRTCPDLARFRLPAPDPALKDGRNRLVLYLGHMGPQDGLDYLLDSIEYLVHKQGRRDASFVLIGPGSEVERLQRRTKHLGLDSYVKFTGALYGDALLSYLVTADVAVSPDPYNVFNDQLTMLKVMEYMACGIPMVLYELTEGRRTAGEAALYARRNDPINFAQQIELLLGSPELCARLGKIGKDRIRFSLNWSKEKLIFLRAYQAALGKGFAPEAVTTPTERPLEQMKA